METRHEKLSKENDKRKKETITEVHSEGLRVHSANDTQMHEKNCIENIRDAVHYLYV